MLERSVQESLAGRASYYDLNTLSVHEMGPLPLSELMIKGGWPELHVNPSFSPVRYLNDLIATFIERDIVAAAGIERKAAFTKTAGLLAGRIGQLLNSSDIARNVGVETTTVQSWIAKLEQNAICRVVRPYFTNLNQRQIKTPKVYFEDVGLASRLQGWTEFTPLFVSPAFGHLFENLVCIEISRFFTNQGASPEIYFLRSKEKVEIDFLVKLNNNRWVAIEVEATAAEYGARQLDLLKKTGIEPEERWCVSVERSTAPLTSCRSISLNDVHESLSRVW